MKELLNYYRGLLERLRRDYRLASEYFGSEAIHELRVDIKRLRALLSFAGSLCASDNSPAPQDKLERLFRRAGKLRHFQLQMDVTRHHMDELGLRLDPYFNFLKQQELQKRKRFRKFCADFDLQFLARHERQFMRASESVTTEALRRQLREHCEMLLQRLRSISIASDSPPAKYHAVRILAKETRYALEALRTCTEPGTAGGEMDRQLLGLHQALGAWHDLDLATIELARYVNQADPEIVQSPESLTKFASALSTERDLQLELFRSRWLDFCAEQGEAHQTSVIFEDH